LLKFLGGKRNTKTGNNEELQRPEER